MRSARRRCRARPAGASPLSSPPGCGAPWPGGSRGWPGAAARAPVPCSVDGRRRRQTRQRARSFASRWPPSAARTRPSVTRRRRSLQSGAVRNDAGFARPSPNPTARSRGRSAHPGAARRARPTICTGPANRACARSRRRPTAPGWPPPHGRAAGGPRPSSPSE